MFSVYEKQYLAIKIEGLIKSLNHPEMDNTNIRFKIHIDGKENWSWADITDNKTAQENGIKLNPWNEISRFILSQSKKKKET